MFICQQDEEEKYLQSITQGRGKSAEGSVFAASAQEIVGAPGFVGGQDGMKKTIGSIKNRQVNYNPEHTFFSPHTDMKPEAQYIRDVVKDEIDKDLLGRKPPLWN